MFPWSGRQKVLRKLFVSSKNARFYLMYRQPNLHELARKFDARNLCKFLAQVSWLCVTIIILPSLPQAVKRSDLCRRGKLGGCSSSRRRSSRRDGRPGRSRRQWHGARHACQAPRPWSRPCPATPSAGRSVEPTAGYCSHLTTAQQSLRICPISDGHILQTV